MPIAEVRKVTYPGQTEIVSRLVESIRSIEIAPRRALIVTRSNRYDLSALMQELARQVNGHYVDHLADCLQQLSDFPLEAYKPRDLRDDLKEMLDQGGKILIVGELEWILAIWDETEQRRFFQLMATFAAKRVLVLACRLPLDYETLIGDRCRVMRFDDERQ